MSSRIGGGTFFSYFGVSINYSEEGCFYLVFLEEERIERFERLESIDADGSFFYSDYGIFISSDWGLNLSVFL